jgi:autoinducer 2 (AI-2) kinase
MQDSGYILTIDVGTGSGRAIVFDENGNQMGMGQCEWLPESLPQYPGSQVFNTKASWHNLTGCITEALRNAQIIPSRIAGVTATSMREGIVLYDKQKREIWACPNVDARATKEVEDMVAAGLGEPIYETGGDWLSIIAPPRLWWIKRNLPETYERIAYIHMLSDWVLYRLCGEIVTDVTCGSSSGIFDLRERNWSKDLIALANLPENIYPSVYEPGTVIGKVTKKAASETGLAEGTPVITAGGDTQMALLGSGAVTPCTCTIIGGTFWQTTINANRPIIDPQYRLRTLCYALPDQWMVEGIGFYHGFIMRWFRDGFCNKEIQEASELGIDPYSAMEQIASSIPPGSNGVQAIFSDIMNARRWKHAAPSLMGFDVLDPEKTGKAACIRAIEENAAYTSRGHVDILKELSDYSPREATFAGGSAKGSLWPQIMADVLGFPMKIPIVKEATSLGSLICACFALGWYGSLSEASQHIVKWESEVVPVSQNVQAYEEHYQRWREVYKHVLTIVDTGLLKSMWQAPGT